MIPLDQGEKPGSSKQSVTINGYKMVFPKGEFIDIPRQVAEILQDKFRAEGKLVAASIEASKTEDERKALE